MTGARERHLAAFRRAAVDLIDERELAERLGSRGRALRVKFGMDPSSPDLHVGHAVVLRKLRELQELGHAVVLIVGDATAMVGDPSGRNKLRPQLSRREVEANLATYVEQAGIVLDVERTEIRRNSEWFDAMRFEDVLRLAGRMTVAQMIQRDTFQNRVRENQPIGIHEFLYPLMQGWDSVMVKADVELGGTDQLFNLLVGRDLQQQEGQAPQVVLTTPLINGLDGRKMSKSYGNAIGLTDPPQEVFGKTMSLADEAMEPWYRALTDLSEAEVERLLAGHPREAKARLAWELVRFLHGSEAADAARAEFDRRFVEKELPSEIEEVELRFSDGDPPLMVVLREAKLVASSGEGRRLIEQGAVRVDGEIVRDSRAKVARTGGKVLIQVGKRKVLRVSLAR